MVPNPHPPPKPKRAPTQLKPLVEATLRQARRLTRRRSPTPPPPATSRPSTPTPLLEAARRPCTPTPSLFLTFLPPEIRARIYHFVFAGRELRVYVPFIKYYSRYDTHDLRYYELDSTDTGTGKWYAGWRGMVGNQCLEFMQEPKVKGKLLALALCCRQVYTESIRFLYASVGFTMFEMPALARFVDYNRADCMRWMRVMRVEYKFSLPVFVDGFVIPAVLRQPEDGVDWDETCRCLGKMTGLKLLHVTIYTSDQLEERYWASDMMWWMLVALKVLRADEFRVSIRKPFIKFREMVGEAPFEVCEVYEDY